MDSVACDSDDDDIDDDDVAEHMVTYIEKFRFHSIHTIYIYNLQVIAQEIRWYKYYISNIIILIKNKH